MEEENENEMRILGRDNLETVGTRDKDHEIRSAVDTCAHTNTV